MRDGLRYNARPIGAARGIEAMGSEEAELARALASMAAPMLRGAARQRTAQSARDGRASGLAGNLDPISGGSTADLAFADAQESAYVQRLHGDVRAHAGALAAKYPEDPEAFADEFDQWSEAIVGKVRPEVRDLVSGELSLRRNAEVSAIQQRFAANEAVRQEEVRVEFQNDLEKDALKFARFGDEAALGATRGKFSSFWQEEVKAGRMLPEQVEQANANLTEKLMAEVTIASFEESLKAGRGQAYYDRFRNGGAAPELRVGQIDRLTNYMESGLGNQRAEANHAMAQRDHQVTVNTRDLVVLNKKQELGVPLSNEELQRRDSYLSNPTLVAPDRYQEGIAARATFGITRQVATMTPRQIEAVRAQWDATPPQSVEEALIRNKTIAMYDQRQKAVADDPASYLAETMPDKFPPIALPDFVAEPKVIGTPEFEAGMQALASRAGLIKAQVGGEPSPLTKEQTEAFTIALASPNLSAQAKADLAASIDRNFGDQKWPILHAVAKDGAPAFAHIGWLTGVGAKDAALAVANGDSLLKDPKFKTVVDSAIKADTTMADGFLGLYGAFPRTPQSAATLSAAVRAAYAADMAKGVTPDAEEIAKRVGAQVAVYGPSKSSILLPYGVTDVGAFGDRLASVDPAIDPAVKNAPPAVVEALRSGTASLTSLGGGHYAVDVGVSGNSFVLDFNGITEKAPSTRGAVVNWGAVGQTGRDIGRAVDAVSEGVRGAPVTRDLVGLAEAAGDALTKSGTAAFGNTPGITFSGKRRN